MPYVTALDGARLFYLEAGEGKPIVFVHGYRSSHECWNYQVQALCDRYRYLVPHLRGHGESDKPARFSVELAAFAGTFAVAG